MKANCNPKTRSWRSTVRMCPRHHGTESSSWSSESHSLSLFSSDACFAFLLPSPSVALSVLSGVASPVRPFMRWTQSRLPRLSSHSTHFPCFLLLLSSSLSLSPALEGSERMQDLLTSPYMPLRSSSAASVNPDDESSCLRAIAFPVCASVCAHSPLSLSLCLTVCATECVESAIASRVPPPS